ncbi:RNA polymerase sigma factor [Streptomyces sp. 8L]|uniref:RNA polymerase sigma factor n=1 Tax=Streptomyces sp. 8L TaxID=2877242 RepID=UPI001CD437FF|nr:sigma factor [Streptomyces sp. 8L]MCA1222191.1 hypothetical protein [Streptomyces sp. 8L]
MREGTDVSIVAEKPVLPQVAGRVDGVLERPAGAVRVGDASVRALLADWFAAYGPLVERVVGRQVRREDLDLVEDLAQDAWLMAWQHLLSGQAVVSPRGFLAVVARRRVFAHYRTARVRREEATNFQDEAAVARLAARIGAAA